MIIFSYVRDKNIVTQPFKFTFTLSKSLIFTVPYIYFKMRSVRQRKTYENYSFPAVSGDFTQTCHGGQCLLRMEQFATKIATLLRPINLRIAQIGRDSLRMLVY